VPTLSTSPVSVSVASVLVTAVEAGMVTLSGGVVTVSGGAVTVSGGVVTVSAGDVSVTIGAEHPTTGGWEASIVTAPFRAGDVNLGTIGIVGPTRMDYLLAMASVRAVAERLSEAATELDQ